MDRIKKGTRRRGARANASKKIKNFASAKPKEESSQSDPSVWGRHTEPRNKGQPGAGGIEVGRTALQENT